MSNPLLLESERDIESHWEFWYVNAAKSQNPRDIVIGTILILWTMIGIGTLLSNAGQQLGLTGLLISGVLFILMIAATSTKKRMKKFRGRKCKRFRKLTILLHMGILISLAFVIGVGMSIPGLYYISSFNTQLAMIVVGGLIILLVVQNTLGIIFRQRATELVFPSKPRLENLHSPLFIGLATTMIPTSVVIATILARSGHDNVLLVLLALMGIPFLFVAPLVGTITVSQMVILVSRDVKVSNQGSD